MSTRINPEVKQIVDNIQTCLTQIKRYSNDMHMLGQQSDNIQNYLEELDRYIENEFEFSAGESIDYILNKLNYPYPDDGEEEENMIDTLTYWASQYFGFLQHHFWEYTYLKSSLDDFISKNKTKILKELKNTTLYRK